MTIWITHEQAAEILGGHLSLPGKLVARGVLHARRARRSLPSLWQPEVEALAAHRRLEAFLRDEQRRERQTKRVRPPDDDHEWLTTGQVGAILGVSRQAVDHRMQKGKLPHEWSSGRRWIRRDHFEMVERARVAQRTREV